MNIPRTERRGDTAVLPGRGSVWVWAGLLCLLAFSGCAAFHPLQGIPAAYVPDEYLGPSRSGKKTIDLSLLVQRQPDQYRLASGDILSVYVPGVLGSLRLSGKGDIGETPPINLPQSVDDPPTIGYPTAIRDDGTISLPLVPPINVHGMTLAEAENTVRDAYTVQANILNDKRKRVLISLARRREYRVLVVRQETSNELSAGVQPGTVNVGSSKRGTAKVVRLPAYENDVLHALAKADGGADGLPGLDAKNTIYIIRRKKRGTGMGRLPTPALGLPQEDAVESPGPMRPMPRSGPQISPQIGPIAPAAPVGPPMSGPTIAPLPPTASPPAIAPSPPTVPQDASIRSQLQPDAAAVRFGRPETDAAPLSGGLSEPVLTPDVPNRPNRFAPQVPLKHEDPSRAIRELEQRAPEVPRWHRPAEPAESIRRTSAMKPPVWGHTSKPIFRGQSPTEGNLEHTNFSDSPLPSYGPWEGGSMPPATAPPRNAMRVGGHDDSWQSHLVDYDPTVDNPNVIKIPIRLAKGDRPTFTEQDIILQDGDIVFIESRETEVFYIGGLLGGGQYTLPRDYDLRVLEAISVAQSPQALQNQSTRSIGGISALNMDVTFSASHVVILRQLPNGTRMPIEIDLYKALRRPETENILIQPGDLVILQYTKLEAIGAFFERHLIEWALFGIAGAQFSNSGGGGGGF